MSNISLKDASSILSISEDELMYHNQCGHIQASVNENLEWVFELSDILTLKSSLEVEEETDGDS